MMSNLPILGSGQTTCRICTMPIDNMRVGFGIPMGPDQVALYHAVCVVATLDSMGKKAKKEALKRVEKKKASQARNGGG